MASNEPTTLDDAMISTAIRRLREELHGLEYGDVRLVVMVRGGRVVRGVVGREETFQPEAEGQPGVSRERPER